MTSSLRSSKHNQLRDILFILGYFMHTVNPFAVSHETRQITAQQYDIRFSDTTKGDPSCPQQQAVLLLLKGPWRISECKMGALASGQCTKVDCHAE